MGYTNVAHYPEASRAGWRQGFRLRKEPKAAVDRSRRGAWLRGWPDLGSSRAFLTDHTSKANGIVASSPNTARANQRLCLDLYLTCWKAGARSRRPARRGSPIIQLPRDTDLFSMRCNRMSMIIGLRFVLSASTGLHNESIAYAVLSNRLSLPLLPRL
jgi:hypothetical protein